MNFGRKILFFQKTNNCEELNTRFHATFPAAILENPYCTPPPSHVIRHTLLHLTCNMDEVITPLRNTTCCISDLSHMQN
jgi:hypothetical protein